MDNEIIYEDRDVVVTEAPRDDELEKLVIEMLDKAKRPVSWRELKRMFSGIAGEDRLRKTIYRIKVRGDVVELTGTRFILPKYLERIDYSKIKNPAAVTHTGLESIA
ncbi:MAG: hypothetical protein F7B59_02015 [Desulfurococcales archaeon]|nr:hypothetical protein [Desulfurococcales archaeon]